MANKLLIITVAFFHLLLNTELGPAVALIIRDLSKCHVTNHPEQRLCPAHSSLPRSICQCVVDDAPSNKGWFENYIPNLIKFLNHFFRASLLGPILMWQLAYLHWIFRDCAWLTAWLALMFFPGLIWCMQSNYDGSQTSSRAQISHLAREVVITTISWIFLLARGSKFLYIYF